MDKSLPKTPNRTTTGFAFSMIERAIQDCFGARQFGKAEMLTVVEYFGGPACVYCGDATVGRWDHLIPLSRGGETVLGNLVPACSRCDDSKADRTAAEFIFGDARYSPKTRGVVDLEHRLAKIEAFASRFGYSVVALPERLTEEESNRLTSIREKIASVRAELEGLIVEYRARTKLTDRDVLS